MSNYIDEFKTENSKSYDFNCIVISPESIKEISWIDPNYSKKLLQLSCVKVVQTKISNMIEMIADKLETDKYKNVSIKNEIFADEYTDNNYIYEILYIDMKEGIENELASLLNINGDIIYGNAIIIKSKLDVLTDSMLIDSISTNDIERVLYDRVYTKIAVWNDKWMEERVIGDLNDYAKIFFDDEKFEKIEFGFLMHNINIWFIKSDNNDNDILGNLINENIEKCIVFTMKSDEFRGNLSLDELNKIIYLSKKMDNFNIPNKYNEEKIDEFGRKIIYNKYKILHRTFNEFN